MRAVVQRVTSARVTVDERITGEIGGGLLVLVGVEQGDGPADVQYIASKIRDLRIFADDAGKMNLSVLDRKGAVLVVSQFHAVGRRAQRAASIVRIGRRRANCEGALRRCRARIDGQWTAGGDGEFQR
jgi:D-tyrosyl-tRNA(Tyr) deacylase